MPFDRSRSVSDRIGHRQPGSCRHGALRLRPREQHLFGHAARPPARARASPAPAHESRGEGEGSRRRRSSAASRRPAVALDLCEPRKSGGHWLGHRYARRLRKRWATGISLLVRTRANTHAALLLPGEARGLGRGPRRRSWGAGGAKRPCPPSATPSQKQPRSRPWRSFHRRLLADKGSHDDRAGSGCTRRHVSRSRRCR
jgi:hypothetical protein